MWLYRALLYLYPRSFRHEYGEEMAGVHRARLARARGPLAKLALWFGALFEVSGNALAVHLDLLRQDLGQMIRGVRRAPGFAATAVVIIGLGVGANTAAFSVTDFVLFRPLPFPEPDRLVRLWEALPGYSQMELSPANARDWRAHQTSFEDIGLFANVAGNLTDAGDPVRVDGALIDARLFPVLGARPVIGRGIGPVDEAPNAPGVMIISHGLWQVRFGGAADILSRTIRLNGIPTQIVGVMPPSFAFPTPHAEYWAPLQFDESAYEDRNDNFLDAVARLKDGVTLDDARRDVERFTALIEADHPATNKDAKGNVFLLRESYSARSRTLVLALMGAALCLLVITCVNLANLFLARMLARRRELVVRSVMGAGRERLVRQLMTETLVLAVCGGVLGIAIAALSVPLFARLVPTTLPLDGGPKLDWRLLGVALAATLIVGLLAGIMPALGARGSNFSALRDGERAGGGARERLRAGLVAVSIVSSVVLLVGGGLLLRALARLQAVDPGFVSEHVLTVRTALPSPKYDKTEARVRWYTSVVDQVRRVPGVDGAAYISFLPMAWRGGIWPVVMRGDEVRRDGYAVASLRYATPGFFEVMRIPVLQGRDVREVDTASAPAVAVVSRSFVERYWPGESGMGRRFTFAFAEREIVGVVGDIRVRGLERESEPQVYLPAGQVGDGSIVFYTPKELVIRTTLSADVVLPAVREIIRRADPDLPISNVAWMSDIVAAETGSRTVQIRVLGVFAGVALLLAGVGIHGVLSFVVSQRRREIGVRMALGAQRGEILMMVLRRAALIAGVGLAAGLIGAYWTGRALEAALFGVAPTDLPTMVVVTSLVGIVSLAGGLAPALRASRIDPVKAIRAE